LLNVIRKALPYLRQQRSGHIINIASIAGFTGMFPGFGIYCATKFAVHGLTESLSTEVKDFGIYATIVSPGYFRTSFLTPESLTVPIQPIEAYEAVRDSQEMHQTTLNGTQTGDPEKAALAIIKITEAEHPPLHLFLGEDAYQLAHQKAEQVKQELENWQELGTSTGY
jgi:NAD(P)-dependent dehydrogenase (short-subunit alcohol dehydrogenase family)